MKTLTFLGFKCAIQLGNYDNGNTAIILVSVGEPEKDIVRGETVCVASVNLTDRVLPRHVYIKEWSENEGITKILQDAGIISPPVSYKQTGFTKAALHFFYPHIIEEYKLE